ncbi:MAG: flagellar protein [Dehalococcoidia bacterium]|nr:flagellar protein [Dehalococcoidia bacterium]
MADQLTHISGRLADPRRVAPAGSPYGTHPSARTPAGAERTQPAQGGVPFAQLLQQHVVQGPTLAPKLRFSVHAQQRLQQRAAPFGPAELAKVEAAVDRAGQKGGRESLILLNELALVVSVTNRTVITAVETDQAQQSVFTNIDSVVIA